MTDELLWAQRILWAWAVKHEGASMPAPVYHRYMSRVDGGACPQWRAPLPFADHDGVYRGIRIEAFSTPEAATVALAKALLLEDPSLAPVTEHPAPVVSDLESAAK